jgi:hypothetical protein
LELTTELHNKICETAEFRAFEAIGGGCLLEDGNPYLPELDGISAAAIAYIFQE